MSALLTSLRCSGSSGIPGSRRSLSSLRIGAYSLAATMIGALVFCGPPVLEAAETAPLTPVEIQQHREALIGGVREVRMPGIPGPLCVFGPRAFALAVDQANGSFDVFAAAALHGRGRLVALPHNGFFSRMIDEHEPTGLWIAQCFAWAAAQSAVVSQAGGPLQGLRIGVRGYGELQAFLKARGVDVVPLDGPDWTAGLAKVQVIAGDFVDISSAEIQAVNDWVDAGGGIVSANLVWGWQQGHPGADAKVDLAGNRIFGRAGIVWCDGMVSTSFDNLCPLSTEIPDVSHLIEALHAMTDALTGDRARQVAFTVRRLNDLPVEFSGPIQQTVKSILETHRDAIPIPTAKQPVMKKDVRARSLVALELQWLSSLAPEQLIPYRGADVFPGNASTSDATSKPVALSLDLAQHGWKSTGLYAAPGAVVTIDSSGATIPPGAAVQIGCHSDQLWDQDEWRRPPAMVRRFSLRAGQTTVGHSLGGLIYIDVPQSHPGNTLPLQITGAVPAPYYVAGKTAAKTWENKLRNHPAPWAELETRNVILTVPSELIRELDDPKALMDHWTKALDLCAELATISPQRSRPERFVFDVQISAGFLHSGYPIMGHIDPTAPEAVDLRHLRTKGGWGFYHELGHNHQVSDWTFEGTGEVTCNLFSLYVHEKLTPKSYTHDAVQPADQAKRKREYIGAGRPFQKWKEDPFLALIMYHELRREFGWKPFQMVFAQYAALPPSERPQNDDERRDQWMVRFSRVVNKNLGPFFEAWGVPTSPAARASIAKLPAFNPKRK